MLTLAIAREYAPKKITAATRQGSKAMHTSIIMRRVLVFALTWGDAEIITFDIYFTILFLSSAFASLIF